MANLRKEELRPAAVVVHPSLLAVTIPEDSVVDLSDHVKWRRVDQNEAGEKCHKD